MARVVPREEGQEQERTEPARAKFLPAIRGLRALLRPFDLQAVYLGEKCLDLRRHMLVAMLSFRVQCEKRFIKDMGAWAFTMRYWEQRLRYIDVSSPHTFQRVSDELSMGVYDRIEFFIGERNKIRDFRYLNVFAQTDMLSRIIAPIQPSVACAEIGQPLINLTSGHGTLHSSVPDVPRIRDVAAAVERPAVTGFEPGLEPEPELEFLEA